MMLTTSRRGQFFIVSSVLVIMSLHMIGMYITQRHVPMSDISLGQLNEFENLLSAVDTVDTLSDDFDRERNMRALDILFQASLKTAAVDWEGQVRYVSDWKADGTNYRYPVHLTSTYDVEDTVVKAHLEIPLNSSRVIIVKEKGSDDALDDVQMTFQFHLERLYADVNWTALGKTEAFQTRTFYVYLDVSEPDD